MHASHLLLAPSNNSPAYQHRRGAKNEYWGGRYYFSPFALALALFFTVQQVIGSEIKRHKIEREMGGLHFFTAGNIVRVG
jgi:hypothetical protein